MRFEHDVERRRWLGLIGDDVVCALDYADDGTTVSMTRTFTNPPFRRHGYAAVLTEHAVGQAEAAGRRVRPMCWYVAEWFDRHPGKAHLLA